MRRAKVEPPPFAYVPEESHTELLLTVKLGPSAGTSLVTCTCGWDRTYKTRVVAIRELNQHRKNNGLPKTDRWSNPTYPAGDLAKQRRPRRN